MEAHMIVSYSKARNEYKLEKIVDFSSLKVINIKKQYYNTRVYFRFAKSYYPCISFIRGESRSLTSFELQYGDLRYKYIYVPYEYDIDVVEISKALKTYIKPILCKMAKPVSIKDFKFKNKLEYIVI